MKIAPELIGPLGAALDAAARCRLSPLELKLRIANLGRGSFRAEEDTLWLYDVIASDDEEAEWWGGVSPRAFALALRERAAAGSGTIRVRVNSPGGSVFGGQAIAQAIREEGERVVVHVDGLAASAASVVAVAAPRVIMAPGAMMMIHRAWSIGVGNAADMRETADLLEKIDGTIAEAYAARSGREVAGHMAQMSAETWFTAAEAVAEGLADEVAPEAPRAKAGAEARAWDLSTFARAPAAPPPCPPAPEAPVAGALDPAEAEAARARRQRALTLALLGLGTAAA